MKRGMKLGALLAALLVLVGIWLLAKSFTGRRQQTLAEHAHEEPVDIAVGPADAVTAISWNYFGDAVSLRYDADGGAWINADAADCPIDQEAARDLAQAAGSLQAAGVVEDVTDFDQYGLTKPAFQVTAAAGDSLRTYYVGGTAADGSWYVRVDGENKVYLETGTLAEHFQIGLEDVLQRDAVPQDIAAVTGLEVISGASGYRLRYLEDPGEAWYTDVFPWFLMDAEGAPVRPLDTTEVEALYKQATDLILYDCETWRAEDPAKYGLAEPQSRVLVDYTDDAGQTASFGLEFGAYTGGDVYVRLAGSEMVFRVEGTVLDRLMYPDFDAMTPMTPLALDWTKLTGVRMELPQGTYDVTRSVTDVQAAGEEQEERFTCAERDLDLDPEAVARWQRQAYELPMDSLVDPTEGRETLFTFLFFQDSVRWPQVRVEFSRYDSAHYLCAVDGREYYLVSRTAAQSLADKAAELFVELPT